MRNHLRAFYVAAAIIVLSAVPAFAGTYHTSGTVFAKDLITINGAYPCGPNGAWTCYTVDYYYYLTIREPNGHKVKGECVGDTIPDWATLSVGQDATGTIKFSGGYGTWVELEAD